MFLRSVSVMVAGCALLIATGSSAVAQEKRGPSTPEERAQALKYIADFQADPLGDASKSQASWVVIWAIEVPDVHVHLCVLPNLKRGRDKDTSTLTTAVLMAQTAFAIQHMSDNPDRLDEYHAGLEGMLDTYEKVVAANPKNRQPTLDDLLERRKAGTLGDYVKQQAITQCKN